MTKREKLIDYLQEIDIAELVQIHNEYCHCTNHHDDEIFDMDMLDEICSNQGAYWVTCRVFYGDFNPNSEYFTFDGYGNFKSLWRYNASTIIYENEIADYLIENDEDFGYDDIRYILDDIEGDSEQ